MQYVSRPISKKLHDYRAYSGQVVGGVLRPGDEVVVLPSGFTSRIRAIELAGKPVEEAFPPMSVNISLTDELDISRGDMLCRPGNPPTVAQDLDAMVCWMVEQPLRPGAKLAIKHTTRSARTLVKDIQYRIDVNTLHRDEQSKALALNEIGRVSLRTTVPLFFDEYRRNRHTGSFILIDEGTNATVAAGMINGPAT
ncbi:elongation factor 1-alpha C-terminal domain-related protein [Archangium gephyra]|uniref:elongation factor 1-alpha C-terminal domain-related protein n=1 Tax=Archangium gephyra TaxID=48 RepID=UPI003B793B24